ncbi:MAG TPA: 6-pyruvoyl-tetrahydropterin synthase-related protein [Candidatus Acidoferrum sp.]|jgi:hypothetical protein
MSDSPRLTPTSPFENPIREWGIAALLSLCVSLAVLTPFFRLGNASGHDVSFHMASWLDAASQWKQGVIFPRWTEWANFGFGEPRFIFYPPLSWILGAFLGTIIPWKVVAPVFIACVQTFAGMSAYALLRRLTETRFSAFVGAVCFAANPYSLLIIYMRSDFAELLAIAIFPVLFLAALRLTGFFGLKKRDLPRCIVNFAIPFCAAWLANAPAAVIATYSVTLLLVIAALQQRSVVPLAGGGAGMALGFGLAAFYWIPAFYEQRWVNISGILAGGLMPAENFLYAKTADSEHDAFNRIASNIAVLLIFWVLCAVIAAWRTKATGSSRQGPSFPISVPAPFLFLATVATILMFPVTSIFWKYFPELRFLQFPWRWMSVLALCAALFSAVSARGWLRWAWVLAATIAMAGSGTYVARHSWWDSDDMPTLQAAINDGSGFEGTDEYDPAGDDHTDLPQKAPRARFLVDTVAGEHIDAKIVVEKWSAEHRWVRVVAPVPGKLALRLLNYPAWRLTLKGAGALAEHSKGTGQMILSIPAGESEVHVDFSRTIDRAIGGWISLASLAGSIFVLFRNRHTTGSEHGSLA